MKNYVFYNFKKAIKLFTLFFVAFNFNAFSQPDDITFFDPTINRGRDRVTTLNASGGMMLEEYKTPLIT